MECRRSQTSGHFREIPDLRKRVRVKNDRPFADRNRGQTGIVGGILQRVDFREGGGSFPDQSARFRIPEFYRPVARAGCDPVSVGGPGGAPCAVGVPLQERQRFPGGIIPQLNRAVAAGGSQPASIRRKGDSKKQPELGLQARKFLPRRQIPPGEIPLIAARHQNRIVRGKSKAADSVPPVSEQRIGEPVAGQPGFQIPHGDGSVLGARRKKCRRPTGVCPSGESQTVYRPRVPEEPVQRSSRCGVKHQHRSILHPGRH